MMLGGCIPGGTVGSDGAGTLGPQPQVRGVFQASQQAAGEQLLLPLLWGPAMAEGSLSSSAAAVTGAWTADGALAAQTLEKFGGLIGRFVRFAAAHGVTSLAAVDRGLVTKFVAAKGRTRQGAVSQAAMTTMRNRRAALRAFYRTARRLRLTFDDPTADIDVPARTSSTCRPLTDDDAALVRLFAERATPTRHAAAVALLLAGTHTSEAAHVTTADLDIATGDVTVHSSCRYRQRNLPLDPWAVRVLAERAAHLTAGQYTHNPVVLCAAANGSPASRQASVCATVREILTRAGLSTEPGVRPSSLTGYAGRRVFEQTGHVEDAAPLLGSLSLDTTAALIGHRWQPGKPD